MAGKHEYDCGSLTRKVDVALRVLIAHVGGAAERVPTVALLGGRGTQEGAVPGDKLRLLQAHGAAGLDAPAAVPDEGGVTHAVCVARAVHTSLAITLQA